MKTRTNIRVNKNKYLIGENVSLIIPLKKKGLTPRIFPLLVNAQSSRRIGNSNSRPPDLKLGAVTKYSS
jgi:hypothetical protein